MRFIINFFIFGFIFYLIYIFFPEAFHTLVNWASTVYDFFNALVQLALEKFRGTSHTPVPIPHQPPPEHHALAFLLYTAIR